MPLRISAYCRTPGCPDRGTVRGFCPVHDPGPWANTAPMPADWPWIRAVVLRRDNDTCRLCGAHATHVDHIVPRHLGGTDHPANLRALCAACHRPISSAQGGLASGWSRAT